MSFDYSKTAATAERLITRFGASYTLKQKALGTLNSEGGGQHYAPTKTETETSVEAVIITEENRNAEGLTDRTMTKALISTSGGVTPAKNDKLVLDGRDVNILEVSTLSPAGVDALYTCVLEV